MTLRSIRAAAATFEARGWAVELIVCDNNSTDRPADIARAEGAAVVFEPVNQISRARNAGAARAAGDWLVFVDADSHPSPELFAEVANAIVEGRCLAGGATVTVGPAEALSRAVVALWNVTSRVARLAAGSFIFCDARAFREVGGFSVEFFAGEELDLFARLKRLARRTGRSIVILHRHPLLTSDRKARLYSKRELVASLLKTIVTGGRTLRNPRDCFAWYDGRRD